MRQYFHQCSPYRFRYFAVSQDISSLAAEYSLFPGSAVHCDSPLVPNSKPTSNAFHSFNSAVVSLFNPHLLPIYNFLADLSAHFAINSSLHPGSLHVDPRNSVSIIPITTIINDEHIQPICLYLLLARLSLH